MSSQQYKSSRDPDFIAAAEDGILALKDAITWCNGLLAKAATDADFKALIYRCLDPSENRAIASEYIAWLNRNIKSLEHPEQSTPKERRCARYNITQVRSWAIRWHAGGQSRDYTDGQEFPDQPPSLWGTNNYIAPETIPDQDVAQVDQATGYDPYADEK